jgi:aarF domain-containing kinase
MNHVLPAEFTNTLSVLQDQAEPRSFDEVVQAFKKEFGVHPDELFDQFEPKAVAAASLAQVHRARSRETGELVAVKVQYPDMDNMFKGDIKTIEIMMNIVGRVRQLLCYFPRHPGS